MKRILSSLILVVFAFALVPAEYWHECATQHVEHHHDADDHDEEEDPCVICDFDFADVLLTNDVLTPENPLLPPVIQIDPVQGVSLGSRLAQEYRGPPATSDTVA